MSGLQSNIQTQVNLLQNTAAWVELFKIDCSLIGGGVYYFTNQKSASGGNIVFGGITYTAIPIQGAGFDVTSSGTLPKPTLTVSNVTRSFLGAMETFGQFVGATVTRLRTLDIFLDGAAQANSSAYIGPETWLVEQKVMHDKNVVQWSLTTSIDRLGFYFGRQCLKDTSSKNLYAPGISRTRVQQ